MLFVSQGRKFRALRQKSMPVMERAKRERDFCETVVINSEESLDTNQEVMKERKQQGILPN